MRDDIHHADIPSLRLAGQKGDFHAGQVAELEDEIAIDLIARDVCPQ